MSAAPTPWPWLDAAPLWLASASPTRAAMLRAAGLVVESESPGLDERALASPWREKGMPAADRALKLAREKALVVSRRRSGCWVIGADQTLEAENHSGDKAADRADARRKLLALSGREHRLHAAAAVARDGALFFACVETARLAMRLLSEDFIDAYLDRVGDAATESVGAYRIEEIGALLFERVEGDHSTILGLPLLSLLGFLRRAGALA